MSDEKIPCSQPLTVLPADPPPANPIGFRVWEYMGSEVRKAKPGVEVKSLDDIDLEGVLASRDDLKAGDTIYVPSLWGGHFPVTVTADSHGQLFGDSSNLVVCLCFDEDDRHCWTTGGYINKRGVTKGSKVTA